MFENNGFAFDSAGSFFGESTTPSFENGFSNAGPSDGFFSESAFDENGFSTSETSVFGESASYGGGFTQFGSAFSESAFDENGFSTDDSNFFVEGGGFLGDMEPVPRGPKTTAEIAADNISAKSEQKPQKNSEEDSEGKRLKGKSIYNYGSKGQVLDDAITLAQRTKNNPDPKKRVTDENGEVKQSFRDAFNKQTEVAGRREKRMSQIGNNKKAETSTARTARTHSDGRPTYPDAGPLFGNPRYETGKKG